MTQRVLILMTVISIVFLFSMSASGRTLAADEVAQSDSQGGAESKAVKETPSNYQEVAAALKRAVLLERQEPYGPGPKSDQAFKILESLMKADNISPLLMRALEDPDSDIREGAITVVFLRNLPSQNVQNIIKDENLEVIKTVCLKDPNPKTRKSCAGSLAPFGESALPTLVAMLKDSNSNVRASAAGSLGAQGMGAAAALPALRELARDNHPNVRSAVELAIKRIQEPSKAANQTREEYQQAKKTSPKPDSYQMSLLLCSAANDRDVRRVESLLNDGAPRNLSCDNGLTPLMTAASTNDMPMLRVLLSHGADVNVGNSQGTPLILAIMANDSMAVKLLLSQGADPNANPNPGSVFGRTPLMIAAERDDCETVELLLAAGADWRVRNQSHQSARDLVRSGCAPGPMQPKTCTYHTCSTDAVLAKAEEDHK